MSGDTVGVLVARALRASERERSGGPKGPLVAVSDARRAVGRRSAMKLGATEAVGVQMITL